jgi:hypothetical protein
MHTEFYSKHCKGKRPLGRPRRRCEANIKMAFRGIVCEDMDWIQLAQGIVHWWAFLNMVFKTFMFHTRRRIS